MIAAAGLLLAGFYMLNKKGVDTEEETKLPTTEVGKLEAKDLELKYPGSPTEVVKLYWRLNKCMYNTRLKDKDFESLLKQLRFLYDEEFLAQEGNDYEDMLETFKEEKKKFTKEKRLISSYTVDSEKDVVYGEIDGRECATLTTSTIEKVDDKNTQTFEKFVCRKDADGKWKILGWELTDSSESFSKED